MKNISKNVGILLKGLYDYSPEVYNHSMRVAVLSAKFGSSIGLNKEEIEKLTVGGLLHDLGKVCIPDHILNKTSELNNSERDIIEKHPIYGRDFLRDAGLDDSDVLDMVIHHHERIDGTGYPSGIKGDEISSLTKILSICDSYDTMKHDRGYSKGKSDDYIEKELKDNSGMQFDRYYVDLFLNYMNNNKEQITEEDRKQVF